MHSDVYVRVEAGRYIAERRLSGDAAPRRRSAAPFSGAVQRRRRTRRCSRRVYGFIAERRLSGDAAPRRRSAPFSGAVLRRRSAAPQNTALFT